MNLETIQDKIGISSLEIAEITGKQHAHVLRDIREQFEKLQINQSNFGSVYLDQKGESRSCFILDQEQLLILASGYDVTLRSKIINRWLALEIKERKQEELSTEEKTLRLSQIAWSGLSMNDNSKLLLTHKLFNHYEIPTVALPDYTESVSILRPVSALLKQHNMEISATRFNKQLCEAGILERKTRRSKTGEKEFWSISDEYKQFGENQVSPANPRETQPLFYESKFKEVIKMVQQPNLFN